MQESAFATRRSNRSSALEKKSYKFDDDEDSNGSPAEDEIIPKKTPVAATDGPSEDSGLPAVKVIAGFVKRRRRIDMCLLSYPAMCACCCSAGCIVALY